MKNRQRQNVWQQSTTVDQHNAGNVILFTPHRGIKKTVIANVDQLKQWYAHFKQNIEYIVEDYQILFNILLQMVIIEYSTG